MANSIGSLFVSIGVNKKELVSGLKSAGSDLADFTKKTGKIGAVVAGGIGTGVVAVGAGIKSAAEASIDLQTELDEVRRQLGDLSDDESLDALHSAQLLERAYGEDVSSSLNAVGALMDEFNLSSRKAFDFLSKGFEKGLNNSDDFADSIKEYSNQFSSVGFDAAQFFSIMETGAGRGVLGTDKISDAIKEMNLRLLDGGSDVSDAFTSIGLDFERISGFIKSGDENWSDYFMNIVDGLNSIEDPMERQRAATAIFGTQAEDLTTAFSEGLSSVTTSFEDLNGSTDTLSKGWTTLGTLSKEEFDKVLLALKPLTDGFYSFVDENKPLIQGFFDDLSPVVEEWAVLFSDRLGGSILIVGDSLKRIGEALGIIDENGTGTDVLIALIGGSLDLIVTSVEAGAIGFHLLADGVEAASDAWEDLKNSLSDPGAALETLNRIQEVSALFSPVGAVSGLAKGAGKSIGAKIFGFDKGGVVPGMIGEPVPALVHGGEIITPPGKQTPNSMNIGDITITNSGDTEEMLKELLAVLRAKLAQNRN